MLSFRWITNSRSHRDGYFGSALSSLKINSGDKRQAFLQWYKEDISRDFMELIKVTMRPGE